MLDLRPHIEAIARDGVSILPQCLTSSEVEHCRLAVMRAMDKADTRTAVRRDGAAYAMRNLVEAIPELKTLASGSPVRPLMDTLCGRPTRLVRSILFDKHADANWGVFWHQDLTIAVRNRTHVAGFHNWSTKAGVVHVQPPVSVLEHMLAIRIHLDDCFSENGALRVIPGSHAHGRLSAADTTDFTQRFPAKVCEVKAGDAILMRPLLLHSSGKASTLGHRRVLHFEFAACELPEPLQWCEPDCAEHHSA